jgi:hypothetical protein
LPNSWQTSLGSQHKPEGEVSIYSGTLSPECLVKSIATIKKAFPALPLDFFDVLVDRIRATGFNDARLMDAVNYVIDTIPYPIPSISNFISFDRRYKIYRYDEMLKKADELGAEIWNSYQSIRLTDHEKPVWVHVNDIKQFNLTK